MCGIAGIIDFNNQPIDQRHLENMHQALLHRGPDGYGVFTDNNVGIIHRRLKIIDISDQANQPMVVNQWVLSFNGEIYNYKELRIELEKKGAVFKTQSDTEVILWSYIIWGEACFEKFNGMWALVLYNTNTKEIILSRDRFGKKPLYYCYYKSYFIFASEIKAILSLDFYTPESNRQYWQNFIISGGIDQNDYTFFKDILSFPKATLGKVASDKIAFSSYWKLDFEHILSHYDYNNPEEEFTRLLTEAINIRLRSDVPLGSCLSGGLDSSSIVCIASKLLKENRLCNFTSFYDDAQYNEKHYAEYINHHTSSQANYVTLKEEDIFAFIEKGVYHTERPCNGPTLVSQLNVMRAAHE